MTITKYPDKFNMPQEQNVFYAKRNLVDYIWKSANMENIAITYPDTDAVYNGAKISGLVLDEIVTINNLKHAWMFVLDALSYETDYPLICNINRTIGANLIYGSGSLRTVPVSVGGTDWIPDMPLESVIKEELEQLLGTAYATDKALSTALYLMRKQMFTDGNKRTAILAANHILIRNGVGILSVPIDLHSRFFGLLLDFYKSGDDGAVKSFLYDNCIYGC